LTILYEFEVTSAGEPMRGNGAPGTGTLYVNGKKVGSVDMDVTVPFLFSIEGLSIGHDYGDSVDHANHKPPFRFTGNIEKVTFDLSGDAIRNAEAETRRALSNQ
jgi:arylsulfatase